MVLIVTLILKFYSNKLQINILKSNKKKEQMKQLWVIFDEKINFADQKYYINIKKYVPR